MRFAQDDVGYAAINDAATGKVLVVTPGNVALEVALGTERAKRLATFDFVPPDVLESADYRRDAETGAYDLVIYDQCAPAQMPRANTLFIGRLPPGPVWRRGEDASGRRERCAGRGGSGRWRPQIIDWDRANPLLAHVELGDVDDRRQPRCSSRRAGGDGARSSRPPGRSPRSHRATVTRTPCWASRSSARTPTARGPRTRIGRCGSVSRLSGSMCSNIWRPAAKNRSRPRCDQAGRSSFAPRPTPTN